MAFLSIEIAKLLMHVMREMPSCLNDALGRATQSSWLLSYTPLTYIDRPAAINNQSQILASKERDHKEPITHIRTL